MSETDDLFHVRVSATDADRIYLLPQEHPDIDFGCRPAPRSNLSGAEVDVFMSQAKIDELNAAGVLSLEVGINASDFARERMTEVGEGDRFAGGTIAPVGLGRAI